MYIYQDPILPGWERRILGMGSVARHPECSYVKSNTLRCVTFGTSINRVRFQHPVQLLRSQPLIIYNANDFIV